MMRSLGIGLAAALFVATLAGATASFAKMDDATASDPTAMEKMKDNSSDIGAQTPINADQRAQGMKEAPAYIAAAKLPCTVADAEYVGSGTGSDKIHAKYYEVACKEGLGFMIVAKDKVPVPTTFDCIIAGTPTPDGKPSTFSCKLPGNRQPAAGLQPVVTKSGRDCAIGKARYVGSTPTENIYEITCTQGGGYLLEDSRDYSGAMVKATNCIDYDPAGNIKCTLLTRPEQFVAVDKLVAAAQALPDQGPPLCRLNLRRLGLFRICLHRRHRLHAEGRRERQVHRGGGMFQGWRHRRRLHPQRRA
jgi:hypothetical protein